MLVLVRTHAAPDAVCGIATRLRLEAEEDPAHAAEYLDAAALWDELTFREDDLHAMAAALGAPVPSEAFIPADIAMPVLALGPH